MKNVETAREFIRRKEAEFEAARDKEQGLRFKEIGREGRSGFLRDAWTFMPQSNLKDEKIFVIERLRMTAPQGRIVHKRAHREGDIEYRIGYFMRGKIGRMRGRWTWGQYCPLIPRLDLAKLLRKAEREGTID